MCEEIIKNQCLHQNGFGYKELYCKAHQHGIQITRRKKKSKITRRKK